MKQYLVQINYKSGHRVEVWFDKFKIENNGSMSWTTSDKGTFPLSIANELSDIESVWQIDLREVPDDVPLPVIEEQ